MICDYSKLLESAGGDRALVDELIGIFKADYPSQLEEIKAAIVANDPKLLYETAHKLKGPLSNMGAYASLDQVIALETMGINEDMLNASVSFEKLVVCLDELIHTFDSIRMVTT